MYNGLAVILVRSKLQMGVTGWNSVPKVIIYMDGYIDHLINSNIGGNFGSGQLVKIKHISYADDMCLLSFSIAGMQKLLNMCDQFNNDHGQ